MVDQVNFVCRWFTVYDPSAMRHVSTPALLLFPCAAVFFACSGVARSVDGDETDGSSTDAGGVDAGPPDGGAGDVGSGRVWFVEAGKPLDVRIDGDPWETKGGLLTAGGCYNFLHGGRRIGSGDFRVFIRMKASLCEGPRFIIGGNNHVIFCDAAGETALEGPLFENDYQLLGTTKISDSVPFAFELIRKGDELRFVINGAEIHRMPFTAPDPGTVGVTPALGDASVFMCLSDARLSIEEFFVDGETAPRPKSPLAVDVFPRGEGGYPMYRIPALAVTRTGVVLAFGEGRKNGISDTGVIDLVLKRSTDRGLTWGPLQIVAGDGLNTHGNPVPIVDRDTGYVWLAFTTNDGGVTEAEINNGKGTREVWVTHSEDDGQSWTVPVNISVTVNGADWRWVATGPGHGIQLSDGRLVVPGNHTLGPAAADGFSHVIYSDDHGATWQMGGTVPGGYGDESTVVERSDGTLMLNFRSKLGVRRREFSVSADRGATWTAGVVDPMLVEPNCEGSTLRFGEIVLFSNPASVRREVLSVRASLDGGNTWPTYDWLYPGPAAYSDLVELDNGSAGILYERGRLSPYEAVSFSLLDQTWIMDGGSASAQ